MKNELLNNISNNEIKKACELAEDAYGKSIPGASRFDSKLGTTAFCLTSNGRQYVIYRGTQEAKDWALNCTAIPWRVRGRWVHGGFAAAQYFGVWKKIRKQLDPAKITYCIGHSLGGACATIAALRLTGFTDVRLITMGRPNVMLKSKKSFKDITNISVVAGSDIVATVPKLCFGPDEGQNIIYLGNDGKNYLNPKKEFRDQDRKMDDLISDHMMETSYSPRIKECKLEKLICD